MIKANGRRTIFCPRCDAPMEASVSTKSMPCPGCHRNIRMEDEVVNDYQARVEYYNEGCVEVGKRGVVISEVRVHSLIVRGEIKGSVRARQSILIAKGGKVFGNIATPALIVEEGGILVGRVEAGPLRASFTPSKTESLAGTSARPTMR